MKAELKKEWVEALRSGEFKQGTERLMHTVLDVPRYCCLGVLCKVSNAEGVDGLLRIGSIIPPRRRESFGLTYESHQSLTHLNDTLRWSFSEIADWIEQNIPEEVNV